MPGRPALYATTREFLDYFSLSSLDQLPPLNDIRDIDDINPSLTLDMSARKQSDKEAGNASVAAVETEEAGVGSRPDDNDNIEINSPSSDWQH